MLSEIIHDYLYRPTSGTEQENVRHFLEALDDHSKPPFDYRPEHLEILRRLAKDYMEKPSFVSFQNLHRSAVAFMKGQDCAPNAPCTLVVDEGEIWFRPYGRIASGEMMLMRTVPSQPSSS